MKSIVLPGQTTPALCEKCGRQVQATFSYGTFRFDNGLIVEDVMRATCDTCGEPVVLAAQSSYRLRTALEDQKHKRTTLRMPQELEDFVALQLSLAGAYPGHEELFFRALLLACHRREKKIGRRLRNLEDPVLQRPRTATLNLNLTPKLLEILEQLKTYSEIENTSDLLRRLLVLADTEELSKAVQEETARLALAYA
ncbi:MAG: hypothetical protein HY319_30935 [Armatimonadetes bacterium]|nr:hypothetical protein [Armatimonadota bacterium]